MNDFLSFHQPIFDPIDLHKSYSNLNSNWWNDNGINEMPCGGNFQNNNSGVKLINRMTPNMIDTMYGAYIFINILNYKLRYCFTSISIFINISSSKEINYI